MNNIQAKLEVLFEFDTKLNQLLDDEKYASFFKQQNLFDDQIKDCINSYSDEDLLSVIDKLKQLQHKVKMLKERADTHTKKLKAQSLKFQSNKKKIKAYK